MQICMRVYGGESGRTREEVGQGGRRGEEGGGEKERWRKREAEKMEGGSRQESMCAHTGCTEVEAEDKIDVDVEAEDKGRGTWEIWGGNDACSRQWRKQKS